MNADNMIMNCDDYQLAIGADPSFAGGVEHLARCVACQTYRSEMQSLDLKIRGALELDVPDLDLDEFLHTNKVVTLASRRRIATPAWFALAASVLIALVIGVRFSGSSGSAYASLADEVLAHVSHETAATRVTNVAVPDDHLHAVVPAEIADMDRSEALITYAKSCPINGNDIPHLVIQGKQGPVTILLMPEENIPAAIELNDERSHGVLLPVGKGSVAIIGSREEKLDEIQKQVLQSVRWST